MTFRVLWESRYREWRVVDVPCLGPVMQRYQWNTERWVLDTGTYSFIEVAEMIGEAVKAATSGRKGPRKTTTKRKRS